MIKFTVSGDASVVAGLNAKAVRSRDEIAVAIKRTGMQLLTYVKTPMLSGKALNVKTGHLRGSINMRLAEDAKSLSAFVGTNVSYGTLWELGFSRKVGAGARGGPTGLSGDALTRYFAKHPPGIAKIAPRPFLAPSLKHIEPTFKAEIEAAVKRACK